MASATDDDEAAQALVHMRDFESRCQSAMAKIISYSRGLDMLTQMQRHDVILRRRTDTNAAALLLNNNPINEVMHSFHELRRATKVQDLAAGKDEHVLGMLSDHSSLENSTSFYTAPDSSSATLCNSNYGNSFSGYSGSNESSDDSNPKVGEISVSSFAALCDGCVQDFSLNATNINDDNDSSITSSSEGNSNHTVGTIGEESIEFGFIDWMYLNNSIQENVQVFANQDHSPGREHSDQGYSSLRQENHQPMPIMQNQNIRKVNRSVYGINECNILTVQSDRTYVNGGMMLRPREVLKKLTNVMKP